jgi:hypothetical protein
LTCLSGIDSVPRCGRKTISRGDAGGARVTFTVAPGMHRLELAPREGGLRLDTLFFIIEDLNATSRICDD